MFCRKEEDCTSVIVVLLLLLLVVFVVVGMKEKTGFFIVSGWEDEANETDANGLFFGLGGFPPLSENKFLGAFLMVVVAVVVAVAVVSFAFSAFHFLLISQL